MSAWIKTAVQPRLTYPTLTGSIVTFNSQYAGLPLKSHKIALTATQSGSGTPSPDNVRTINGYSALNISRVANNNLTPSDFAISTSGRIMTYINEAYSIVPTTNTQSSFILTNAILDYMNVIEAGTYKIDVVFTDNNYNISGVYADLLQSNNTVKQVINGETFTISNSFRLQDLRAALFDFVNGVNMNFKIFITKLSDILYVSIPIGQTVNEGEYDAITGILEVTLPSVQTLQLPPCPIDTLLGENNIWADTGDTTLQYPKFG